MSLASDALAIARAGIRAADPDAAVRRVLHRGPGEVRVGRMRLAPGGHGRIHVVALGKAAGRMADAARRVLGSGVVGIAVTSPGSPAAHGRIRTLRGNHPLPGPASLRAGRALLRYVDRLSEDDAVLFLISGGGSALAEVPRPPVTLADLEKTTSVLLASGLSIRVANALRRKLSEIKGGRLAARVRSRRYATVAISDVVGDPPLDVASGPTVFDPTSARRAIRLARTSKIYRQLPLRVRTLLEREARARARPHRTSARAYVFAATNATALAGAAGAARRRGYRTVVADRPIVGDTDRAARAFVRRMAIAGGLRGARRIAWIAGGETTVELGSKPGRGGRNQEFALTAAPLIAGRPALVLSVGTDGIDGPTDAAGGWVDGTTARRAEALGIDLARELRRHNAYPVLQRLGSLVRTGPTGTNVTDLHVGLRVPTRGRESSRASDGPSSRRKSS